METQMDMKQMGALIQARRTALGLTQRALGAKLGVSDKAVSKWERGLSFPDITLLPLLSGALEVSVAELIGGRALGDEVKREEMEDVMDKTVEYTRLQRQQRRKQAAFWLVTLFFLVGVVVCLIVELAVYRRVGWSLYPAGAYLVVAAVLAPALFAPCHKAECIILAGGAALAAYLFLIQRLTNSGRWALTLGLPILILVAVLSGAVVWAFRHFTGRRLYAVALLLVAVAFVLIGVNRTILLNGIESSDLTPIIGAPLCLLAAAVLAAIGWRKSAG